MALHSCLHHLAVAPSFLHGASTLRPGAYILNLEPKPEDPRCQNPESGGLNLGRFVFRTSILGGLFPAASPFQRPLVVAPHQGWSWGSVPN